MEMKIFWDENSDTNLFKKYNFYTLTFVENDTSFFFNYFNNTRNLDEKVIFRLLYIFMQLENIYIHKTYCYKKILNSRASYSFLYSINFLLNNFKIVVSRLLQEKNFQFHFEYTDFVCILINFIFLARDKI
jgi:hypothetical protein